MKFETRINIYKFIFMVATIFLISGATFSELLYFVEGVLFMHIVLEFKKIDEGLNIKSKGKKK